MSLRLTRSDDSPLPVDVSGVLPATIAGQELQRVASIPVWVGNRQVPLSDAFEIEGDTAESSIQFVGNLRSVHHIGAHMVSGHIGINDDCGDRVGCQMTGGEISAAGNVGDYAGCEMAGGLISIAGDAGHDLGANLAGSRSGMKGGAILVAGHTGPSTGRRMRRGTIAIGQSTGPMAGWKMRAGSILIFGQPVADVGFEMIRGTIVLVNANQDSICQDHFKPNGHDRPLVLTMLGKWLRDQRWELNPQWYHRDFDVYAGDQLTGGRGEIFRCR